MSRMSDMAQTIEELRSAAAAISDAVDWLTKVFSSEPQAEDAPASPPEPELTLEQVRANLRTNPARDTPPRSAPCFKSTAHPSCHRSTPHITRHYSPKRR